MEKIDILKVKKHLRRVPKEVVTKFRQWILFVETNGIFKAQKFPGFRDHALKGNRLGQRSVYLTKKWRAIYILDTSKTLKIIIIEEVSPHDY